MTDAPVFDVTQINLPPSGDVLFVLKFSSTTRREVLDQWTRIWERMWEGRRTTRPLLAVIGPDAELTALTDAELLRYGLRRLPEAGS